MDTKPKVINVTPQKELIRSLSQSFAIFMIVSISSLDNPKYLLIHLIFWGISLVFFLFALFIKIEKRSLTQFILTKIFILIPPILSACAQLFYFAEQSGMVYGYLIIILFIVISIYGFIRDYRWKYLHWKDIDKQINECNSNSDYVISLFNKTINSRLSEVNQKIKDTLGFRRVLRPLVVIFAGILISIFGYGSFYILVLVLLCCFLFAFIITISEVYAFFLVIRNINKNKAIYLVWD